MILGIGYYYWNLLKISLLILDRYEGGGVSAGEIIRNPVLLGVSVSHMDTGAGLHGFPLLLAANLQLNCNYFE